MQFDTGYKEQVSKFSSILVNSKRLGKESELRGKGHSTSTPSEA
jgi:hypothetical protein